MSSGSAAKNSVIMYSGFQIFLDINQIAVIFFRISFFHAVQY